MSIVNDILLVGASQGFLLAVVMLSLRSSHPGANRMLALYLGLESLYLLVLFVMYSHPTEAPRLDLRLLIAMRVLAVPALYLYVRAMTEPVFRPASGHLRHLWVLVPAMAWFVGLLFSSDWRASSTRELQQQWSTAAFSSYVSVVFIGYGLLALRQLNRHSRRLEAALSSVETVSLWWLRGVIALVVAANGIQLVFDGLRLLGWLGSEPKIWLNLGSVLSVIYLISIGGLRQPAVFTESVRGALRALEIEPDAGAVADARGGRYANKYAKSGLDDARMAAIDGELETLMRRDKPYLESGLDLPGLAARLGVRPQELSQVINVYRGCSFYDLINGARIEEARHLLTAPHGGRRKMLDIALSVGFNSQSTFYSQFKKLTGQTPSAYRDNGGATDPALERRRPA